MSQSAPGRALYDDIVFDYAAIKSNLFKVRCEEPTFWGALGDVSGQKVLDLACGSGHYSRAIRARGAAEVTGVDVSPEMVAAAVAEEEAAPAGIVFAVGSADSYEHPSGAVDVVTAQYLLPYARTLAALEGMCAAVFRSLRPGGRFVSVTSTFFEGFRPESRELGYALDWEGALEDGIEVQLTLFGEARDTRVTFPNVLWSRATIAQTLEKVGFAGVDFKSIEAGEGHEAWASANASDLAGNPVVFFVARRPE